jgi:hypothetical protein
MEEDNKLSVEKTEEVFELSFSKEEIVAIIQLIDIATKAQGLQVAEVATYFHKKFRNAADGK